MFDACLLCLLPRFSLHFRTLISLRPAPDSVNSHIEVSEILLCQNLLHCGQKLTHYRASQKYTQRTAGQSFSTPRSRQQVSAGLR